MLALGALASRAVPRTPALCWLIPALTIAGLALFYGHGLITPAISVLSAVEGLETAAPPLGSYVVPLAALVLLGLFLIQPGGTARVGALFGPVMLAWFATLGVLGLAQIVQNPAVLAALDPRYAVGLSGHAGWHAFVAVGAIVLAVTGAEALYADKGHFGRTPIRLAWLGFVLPGLVLNYFGQGALVLRDPAALEHPFYHLVPGWALWPLIGLATCATIIASQPVISDVFSLTRQAIQFGYLPRMTIKHTSATKIGQIYIPRINWLLMTGVLLLVFGFRSSGNLAAACGIAVTGAMAIDAILASLIAAWRWAWGPTRGTRVRRLSGDRPRVLCRQRAQDPLAVGSRSWWRPPSPIWWSPGATVGACCGTSSLVFVETAGHVRRRFVGVSECEKVRWRLAMRFPWLEAALAHAQAAVWPKPAPPLAVHQGGPIISNDQGRLESFGGGPEAAAQLLRAFLDEIQGDAAAAPPSDEWETLPSADPPKVERARWLTPSGLEQIMDPPLINRRLV